MTDVSIADLPAQIALALSLASSSTGADYHYLVNTARTESSFQAEAKAPTSSAQGLFQFIEETWIRTIKDEGPRLGLAKYATWISKTAGGRYQVDTPEHRALLLKLRNDPKVAAMMAAAYARQNEEFVRSAIGRRPTSDELYIAHFLGPADAVRLINYRDNQPALSAPDLFPAAAKANRPIFFSDAGPRSVGQVYDLLAARQHGGGAVASADTTGFFAAGIDFGTWSPTVQKIYTTKARPAKVALASADASSLFDFFTGTSESASAGTKPPAAAEATASAVADGWGAEVDTGAPREVPYITVADDYPSAGSFSLLGGGAEQAPPETATVVAATARAPLKVALAEAEAPRIKIIHVPQN